MAAMWKRSGVVKGIGIPAPSGQHPVGCVDLMHQFEGDENGGLLVRLFYPAELGPNPPSSPSQYAMWNSHKRYTKGYMEYSKSKAAGFLAALTNTFITPRIPAVYGATLLGAHPPPPPSHSSKSGTGENAAMSSPSEEGVNAASEHHDGGAQEDSPGEKPEPPAVPFTPTYAPFPVVVFSHGLGAMRCTYSAICCDLASHGYVVAAVEHRDRSACASLKRVPGPGSTPDQPQFQDEWLLHYHRPETEKEFPFRNKQVLQRSREAILALELLTMLSEGVDVMNMMEASFDFKQFQGKLDIGRAAVMGHSFGGSTTIQALSEDQRFLCGLALDTWMIPIHRDLLESGVQQPLFFINSFDFQWVENMRKMVKLTRPPNDRGVTPCRILTLRDTNHVNQSDSPFVIPMFAQRLGKWVSRLDPNVAHAVNMDICHAFLRRYLLKDPSFFELVPNLDGGEGHSEHILFGTNVDLSEPLEERQPQTSSADGAAGQADQSEIGTNSENKGEDTSKEREEEKGEEDKTREEGKEGEKGEGEELGSGKEQAQKNTVQVEEDSPKERAEGQGEGQEQGEGDGDKGSAHDDAQTAKL